MIYQFSSTIRPDGRELILETMCCLLYFISSAIIIVLIRHQIIKGRDERPNGFNPIPHIAWFHSQEVNFFSSWLRKKIEDQHWGFDKFLRLLDLSQTVQNFPEATCQMPTLPFIGLNKFDPEIAITVRNYGGTTIWFNDASTKRDRTRFLFKIADTKIAPTIITFSAKNTQITGCWTGLLNKYPFSSSNQIKTHASVISTNAEIVSTTLYETVRKEDFYKVYNIPTADDSEGSSVSCRLPQPRTSHSQSLTTSNITATCLLIVGVKSGNSNKKLNFIITLARAFYIVDIEHPCYLNCN